MCIVGAVEVFARFPFASVEAGGVPSAAVWAYYLVPLVVVSRGRLRAAAGAALAAARRAAGPVD